MTGTAQARSLQINEQEGDLFAAPRHFVLVHACNCKGIWGKGIAAEFKKQFPDAFEVQKSQCREAGESGMIGKAMLIPPSQEDDRQLWIGCLFTSRSYGKNVDDPEEILRSTKSATQDLLAKISRTSTSGVIKGVRMCRINSGSFNVDWKDTLAALKSIEVGDNQLQQIEVVFRA